MVSNLNIDIWHMVCYMRVCECRARVKTLCCPHTLNNSYCPAGAFNECLLCPPWKKGSKSPSM